MFTTVNCLSADSRDSMSIELFTPRLHELCLSVKSFNIL